MKKIVRIFIAGVIILSIIGCSSGSKDYQKEVASGSEASINDEVKSSEETSVANELIAEEVEASEVTNKELILSTTTSTRDSGLLDYILGDFTKKTGIEVKVIAVGTGKALQMGQDGEADVLLVHAKASEEAFVANGYGTKRFDVMYNDFVLVGPSSDEAKLKSHSPNDIVESFKSIYSSNSMFVSRGDDSGTNKKELAIWGLAELSPVVKEFYLSTGKGMGDVLLMADELNAYTLTDRATYLSMMDNLESEIIVEKDDLLFNQYGVIPVNPELNEFINYDGALAFVNWILSENTQKMIGIYGSDKFGMPLFTPNAE